MKKTLLLVDGSSYLYRAYYALPDLRNALGEPTSALYGVINMLRKLRQDYATQYVACIFDAKGSTFRDELYPLYKANRPSMPKELAVQLEPLHETIAAMGWPVFSVPGVEADDVIATLAHQASQKGFKTIVSTSDKDLAQLVNDNIELVNTMTSETQDVAGVIEKFGVRPDQIVDYLMLVGDTSDNVPGVRNVGPKTAERWLKKYGSLENIIKEADSIKGVTGENLRAAIPDFELTRRLLTVRTDCEVPVLAEGWDALKLKPQDTKRLIELFDHYGFRSWLREVSGDPERIPEN
ncbi:MAG TPA: 5'-3' exonuclease H3TH domain-containing protein, partial [Burkholderiaceae bacterium]|nr:5'-3' exonuclease H3TH domain-containing protein [Burkholderiaceae bacterium]